MRPVNKWAVLALIASTIVIADQVTKYLAVAHLTYTFQAVRARTLGEKIEAFVSQKELRDRGLIDPRFVQVVPSFWQFMYAENRGAAWGFLSGAGDRFRVPFFYLISVAAVVFIFSYYRKLDTGQRYLQIALALVLGGAIGNTIDRLLHGYVIDFIDWHWNDRWWQRPSLHWPTFNVADSAITVGLVMLFLDMLLARKPVRAQAGKPSP